MGMRCQFHKTDRELMEKLAESFSEVEEGSVPKPKYRPKRKDSRSVNDPAA